MIRNPAAMDQDPTVLAQDARTPPKKSETVPLASPQPMALVKGSGPHFTDEVHELLRGRLRVASSIAFVGFATFLVWVWFGGPIEQDGADGFDRALQIAVVAILGALCSLL